MIPHRIFEWLAASGRPFTIHCRQAVRGHAPRYVVTPGEDGNFALHMMGAPSNSLRGDHKVVLGALNSLLMRIGSQDDPHVGRGWARPPLLRPGDESHFSVSSDRARFEIVSKVLASDPPALGAVSLISVSGSLPRTSCILAAVVDGADVIEAAEFVQQELPKEHLARLAGHRDEWAVRRYLDLYGPADLERILSESDRQQLNFERSLDAMLGGSRLHHRVAEAFAAMRKQPPQIQAPPQADIHPATFVDACLTHGMDRIRIADWLDSWLTNGGERSLEEHLGFTREELVSWLKSPSAIDAIVSRRGAGDRQRTRVAAAGSDMIGGSDPLDAETFVRYVTDAGRCWAVFDFDFLAFGTIDGKGLVYRDRESFRIPAIEAPVGIRGMFKWHSTTPSKPQEFHAYEGHFYSAWTPASDDTMAGYEADEIQGLLTWRTPPRSLDTFVRHPIEERLWRFKENGGVSLSAPDWPRPERYPFGEELSYGDSEEWQDGRATRERPRSLLALRAAGATVTEIDKSRLREDVARAVDHLVLVNGVVMERRPEPTLRVVLQCGVAGSPLPVCRVESGCDERFPNHRSNAGDVMIEYRLSQEDEARAAAAWFEKVFGIQSTWNARVDDFDAALLKFDGRASALNEVMPRFASVMVKAADALEKRTLMHLPVLTTETDRDRWMEAWRHLQSDLPSYREIIGFEELWLNRLAVLNAVLRIGHEGDLSTPSAVEAARVLPAPHAVDPEHWKIVENLQDSLLKGGGAFVSAWADFRDAALCIGEGHGRIEDASQALIDAPPIEFASQAARKRWNGRIKAELTRLASSGPAPAPR